MRVFLACALLLALVACGNETTGKLQSLQQLFGQVRSGRTAGPTADQIRASATPEALAQIGKPVTLSELPQFGLADILVPVGENGAYETWISSDGVTVTLKHGILTATRGIGFDLMSADISGAEAAIRRGAGHDVLRVHRYLDGQSQVVIRSLICNYGRRDGYVVEHCATPGFEIENRYWFGRGGQIVRSRQWIGEKLGYIRLERLS